MSWSTALVEFLKNYERRSTSSSPIAVFDCDGTVISGDIGEAMLYTQIEEFHFRVSPGTIWPDHPRRKELDELYESLAGLPPGSGREGEDFQQFAAMILSWYFDQLRDGLVAKACTDIVRLLAGYTIDEVRALARRTVERELASPITTRNLGGRELPMGSRYIQEILELLRNLLRHGFEVWAVSGSNRWSVEQVFERIGIPPERVVGIELRERDGLVTPEARSPIPVGEGKIEALRERQPAIPALVASDSPYDIPLLLHAGDLRVRVKSGNLPATDFFRNNNITPDESWILIENPTFIENEDVTWLMQQ